MPDFLHRFSGRQLRELASLCAGAALLVFAALFLGSFSKNGFSNIATVICGTGVCTNSTTHTSISAAQGVVDYGTPATLTWSSSNVQDTSSMGQFTCFGDNNGVCAGLSSSATTGYLQEVWSNSARDWAFLTDSSGSTYATIANNAGGTTNGSLVYKWIPASNCLGDASGNCATVSSSAGTGVFQNIYTNGAVATDAFTIGSDSYLVNADNSTPYGILIYKRVSTYNNGILVSNPPTGVSGKIGQAVTFNGSSQYMTAPYSSSLAPTTAISLSAWVKTGDPERVDVIARFAADPFPGYALNINANGTAPGVVCMWVGDNTNGYVCTTQTVNDGAWHHIMGTYDGSTVTVYIDGVSRATGARNNGLAENATNITIGPYLSATSVLIDEVRIYNRTLSASEVTTLYGLGNVTSGLVGYWTFDTADISGSTVYDKNPNPPPNNCFGSGTTCANLTPFIGEFQRIYSSNTNDVKEFTVGTDTYLAIANNDNTINTRFYKWMPTPATMSTGPIRNTAAGGGSTYFDRGWQVAKGETVTKIGTYSVINQTVTLKIAKRNAVNNYDIVVSQSCAVTALTWTDCTLTTPYTVPSDGGAYYAGVWESTTNIYTSTNGVPIANATGDVTGVSKTFGESINNAVAVRVTYQTPTISSCFGDGVACASFDPDVGVLQTVYSDQSMETSTFTTTDSSTYLAISNYANGGSYGSTVHKWMPKPATTYSVVGTSKGSSGSTLIETSWKLDNGRILTAVGTYLTVAQNVTFKIAKRNLQGTYDIVQSLPVFSHPGTGWASTAVSYTVPASGDYYVGAYFPTTDYGDVSGGSFDEAGQAKKTGDIAVSNGVSGFVESIKNLTMSATYQSGGSYSCWGDGTSCASTYSGSGVIQQYWSWAAQGLATIKFGSNVYLASLNVPQTDVDDASIYVWMTSTNKESNLLPAAANGNTTFTMIERSWTLDNNRTVTAIGAYYSVLTPVVVKIVRRDSANNYTVMYSQATTTHPGTGWVDFTLTTPYTVPATGEYFVGVYGPSANVWYSNYDATDARAYVSGDIAGTKTSVSEDTTYGTALRATYSTSVPVECFGDGVSCANTVAKGIGTLQQIGAWTPYSLSMFTVNSDLFLGVANNGGDTSNGSRIYKWTASGTNCPTGGGFGDGTACADRTWVNGKPAGVFQSIYTGSGRRLVPFTIGPNTYLAAANNSSGSRIYQAISNFPIVSIMVAPAIAGNTTDVSWSAKNITSCDVTTVNGTGLSVLGIAGPNIATTTRKTTAAPANGTGYKISCGSAYGIREMTAYANIGTSFFPLNGVNLFSGFWPMPIKDSAAGYPSGCATDGSGYPNCFVKNFVSNYGATGIFGAHVATTGVGTIVGQFGGHGQVASLGGGREYTYTWSGPQFPSPPTITNPGWNTSIVVNTGSPVRLEWTCQQFEDQHIQNGCSWFCGDHHDYYAAYYSDSTVSIPANFTGGALYGSTTVTVNADTTYSVQCIASTARTPVVTYPSMNINVYVTGSPNIPPPPTPPSNPNTVSGCAVFSSQKISGITSTTTVTTGDASPIGGFVTDNLLRSTTFTLSCNMTDGTTEQSSIYVKIPPIVSVSTSTDAGEPSTSSDFTVALNESSDVSLTIPYTISGNATEGTDYTTLSPHSVTIPAGQTQALVTVSPIDDLLFEGDETAVLTLGSGTGYMLSTSQKIATTTIIDNEFATSLPTSTISMTSCIGTAGPACELGVNPARVRKGTNVTVTWYVSGMIVGANGNSGDSCSITRSPIGGTNFPASSPNGVSSWINTTGVSETIQSITTFTLTCKAPNNTTATSTSKTVNIIPDVKEI